MLQNVSLMRVESDGTVEKQKVPSVTHANGKLPVVYFDGEVTPPEPCVHPVA
jgi:hypothetical protein